MVRKKNPQEKEDGDTYTCDICGKVFSSLKAVHGHQKVHKAVIKDRRQRTLKCKSATTTAGSSSSGSKYIKMEGLSSDELVVAKILKMLPYSISTVDLGVCSSSTALSSNDPPILIHQQNQEDDCLGTPTTMGKINNNNGSSSGDVDGSRVFQCPRCPKRFQSQQALGGHMAGHNNMDRKATALAKEGTSSSAQVIKEHKCNICGATFDSGQALGGHMRKHCKEKGVIDGDDHQPETAQIDNDQKDVTMVDDDTSVDMPVQVSSEEIPMVANDGVSVNMTVGVAAVDVIMEDDHESSDRQRLGGLVLDLNEEPVEIDED